MAHLSPTFLYFIRKFREQHNLYIELYLLLAPYVVVPLGGILSQTCTGSRKWVYNVPDRKTQNVVFTALQVSTPGNTG